MKKFVKNPQLDVVVIPGHGPVASGQVLEGDNLSRFSPRYLTEVPEVPEVAPLESTTPAPAKPLTEPAPSFTIHPETAFLNPSTQETPAAPKAPLLIEDLKEAPAPKPARASKPPKNGPTT